MRREIASIRGYFVDPSGSPRTENILKVAGGVSRRRGPVRGRAQDRQVSKRSIPEVTEPTGEKTPIQMLHDRVLVAVDQEPGERRSSGGILIPATAAMGGRRLSWCRVVAVGPHVRTVEVDDRVLFDPEDKAEVEVTGELYVVLRERDIHAVAADRLGDSQTGLYL